MIYEISYKLIKVAERLSTNTILIPGDYWFKNAI